MKIAQYAAGMTVEPGDTLIVAGMPNDVYHSHSKHVSNSGLSVLARSPAHFMYAPSYEPSAAMIFGSAVHAALLEPELFENRYICLEGVKDRRAAEYKAAVEAHGAEYVIMPNDANAIRALKESVSIQPTVKRYLDMPGYRELSLFGVCSETGVPIRCRFDSLTESLLAVDLKTTRDARPSEFSKSIYNYRYHVQDAFYRHVFKCVTGMELQGFKFVAIESEPPHAGKVYELDETARQEGKREFMQGLVTYAECLRDSAWPMYGDDEELISLPDWKLRQLENEIEGEII